MNKFLYITAFLLSIINVNSFGQIGCPSNYPSSTIKGPDSLKTHGDQTFRSLIVNPKNPNTVYIGTEGSGVFKSTDGGLTWKWKRNGLKRLMGEYPETYCLAINPEDTSELMMGVSIGAGNPLNTPAGIYMSNDGGETWSQRNCGITCASIGLTWYDELHPDTIFALSAGGYSSQGDNTFYPGGIFCSFDKGMNWFKTSTPANIDSCGAFRVIKHGNTVLLYLGAHPSSSSKGFIKSLDGGLNWTYLENPLQGRNIAEYDANPGFTEIYAVVRDSFIIYKSVDTGKTWSRKEFELNGLISIYPNANDTVFFDHGGTLVRSTNKLNTYYPGPDYTDVINTNKLIEKIVYAGADNRIIYMSTRGYRLYKSTDGGHSFQLMIKLRDIIDIFQDTIPEVSVVYATSCAGSIQHLSILNHQPNYGIVNCTWSGDDGLFNSIGTSVSHIFSSNNGVGDFPISANINFDNGTSRMIYDTIHIEKANVQYNTTSLNRNDTLFAQFQNFSDILSIFWNDLNNGTLYYSGQNPYLPIATLPNLNNIDIVMNAQSSSGCTLIDTIHLSILNTSTTNYHKEEISIYPNPINEELYLQIPGNSTLIEIKIINMNGKVVYQSDFINNDRINLSKLSDGVYQLLIKTDNKSYSTRFLKL